MSTTPAAPSRKPNRRGVAAREQLLSTALRLLGDGRPEAVSINLVAKEAGLSWGSVQNLFGDSDGFWSAVVDLIIDVGPGMWAQPSGDTVAGRVAEVVELYRGVLTSPQGIAIETIRAAGATAAGVLIALDRQERGQGELSAPQEVSRDYGLPVTAIATLADILATLQGRPEHRENVARIEDYRRRYGVATQPAHG